MNINSLARKRQLSRTLSDHLYEVVHGRVMRSGLRERLAAGSFDAVLEHHRSVVVLVEKRLYASAFALLRPMFDGCLTGLWVIYLATGSDLDLFTTCRKAPLKPSVTITRLIKNGMHSTEILTTISKKWQAMSDFVHGGYSQIVRRNGEDWIGSNYAEAEIQEVLMLANWFALLAAVELPQLSSELSFFDDVVNIASWYNENKCSLEQSP